MPHAVSAAMLILKITILLACGGTLAALMRGRAAAVRHCVWLVTLSSILGLGIAATLAPEIEVDLPSAGAGSEWSLAKSMAPSSRLGSNDAGTSRIVEPSASRSEATPPSTSASARGRSRAPFSLPRIPGGIALGIWLTGFLAVLLWGAIGHHGLARLERAATAIDPERWRAELGVARVRAALERGTRVALSDRVGSPLTWGWPRAVILLPHDAEAWPAARRRAALLHELAHVERGDHAAQWIAAIACALYWFHPGVWLAAARLRSESERACDDRVLEQGSAPPDYASSLIEVARRATALRGTGLVAVGMARHSHLEGRLLAILDEARPRGPLPRRAAAIAILAVSVLLIPFAALAPRVSADPPSRTIIQPDDQSDSKSLIEREISTRPGQVLDLDLRTGADVSIRGWDKPAVHVRVSLSGPDWQDSRATIQSQTSGVLVRTDQLGHARTVSTSHSIEVRVPRRYDVRVRSAGGGVSIDNVQGTFNGNTGGGEIEIRFAKGHVTLATGGGDIRVSDSRLSGEVSTGGGTVRFDRVEGGLQGRSGGATLSSDGEINTDDGADGIEDSRSGDDEDPEDTPGTVEDEGDEGGPSHHRPYLDVLGAIRMNKSGGDVSIGDAPHGATITTGGGDIHVGRASGMVAVNTGGGDITVGPVAGSVRAGTGAGDVHVTLSPSRDKQTVDVISGTGDVVVELPGGCDVSLDLETAFTSSFRRSARIVSDWSLRRDPITDWDDRHGTARRYVRAHGTIGDGRGRVKIRTVNGDIEIRRTRK